MGISLVSCDVTDVTFTEPQPQGNYQKNKIKAKFTGSYMCLADSSILKVSKTTITQNWDFEVELESDQNPEDVSDRISVSINGGDLQISPTEDSLKYHVSYSTIVFDFSESELLNYVKGVYFLNYRLGDNSWDVKTMRFDKEGYLLIHDLDLSVSDVQKLMSLTDVSEETDDEGKVIDYHLQPTKKEFNDIMNSDLFEEGSKFVRVVK